MVVKERPKSPLFIILCILLAHAARHEIIHQIHVKKWLQFSFMEVTKFSTAHMHPLYKICDGFHMQALISMALLLKKKTLERN